MFCQACRAYNPEDQEYCRRCNQKLLVLSGGSGAREEALSDLEEDFSFDEHLLERISILEEALKRATETVERLEAAVRTQEESQAVTEAGLATIRELLERKGLVSAEEWEGTWDRHRRLRLLALEKRGEFRRRRDLIVGLHQGDRGPELDHRLDDVDRALAALDLDRTLRCLASALEVDPDNPELARFLGELHFDLGDSDRALPLFLRVLERRPDQFEGLVYTGVIYHERGRTDEARKRLARACELYPDSFLAFFSLGAVLAAENATEEAKERLERAVALDRAPQALYLLGRCQHELGRTGTAIELLREAVAKSPGLEEAHYQLGMALLDRRWHRKALEAFRRAHRLNPTTFHDRELVRYLTGPESDSPFAGIRGPSMPTVTLGHRALSSGDPETAQVCFREALEETPESAAILVYYALACLAGNRVQEVEPAVRRAMERNPGENLRAAAYAVWIEALRAEGRLEEGNRIGRRMLEESSTNLAQTIAYYELASNLAELEEGLSEALDYARRARELAPEELRPFPLSVLGWVHYKRQELEEAVHCLDRAAELLPSGSILTQLGMALLAAGEEVRAREVLARARTLRDRGQGVEFRTMECLRESDRLHARLQDRDGTDEAPH